MAVIAGNAAQTSLDRDRLMLSVAPHPFACRPRPEYCFGGSGVPPVLTERVGGARSTLPQGRRTRWHRFYDQAGNRSRTNPLAHAAGLPGGVVLMDAGYGASTELRSSIAAFGLTYVAGILPNTTVWEKGEEPLR
jgi:hypothetical protein